MDIVDRTNTDPPPEPAPQLFRFGLRQLLWFATGTTVLVGVVSIVPLGWALVISVLASMTAAHLLGATLGTRLRDASSQRQRWNASREKDSAPKNGEELPSAATPISPLSTRRVSSSLWRRAAIGLGLLIGGTIGLVGIGLAGGEKVTWMGLALASASAAVLGAWIAMLGAGFLTHGGQAWREASDHDARTRLRRR
jgi:hypothetical protein